jgi:penicillin-binding protein 2
LVVFSDRLIPMDEDDWQAVVAGMVDVVHSPRGTAGGHSEGCRLPNSRVKPAPRRWSASRKDAIYDEDAISERNRNHGLFVAFAPVENPRIVVAVIAENGGGSGAASPVARRILDAWLGEASDV